MKIMKAKLLILSTLLTITQFVFADNKANLLLDQVRNDLISMSANFVQYEVDANERMSEKLTGVMWLKSPNQFKWEYKLPTQQLIVASGEKVWIYDEDLEQVTIKKQNSKQNPIYVLLNKESTEKNYKIEMDKLTDGVQLISMLPKMPSDEIKQVWIGVSNNNIKLLILKNQLDINVVFKFDKVVRNPKLEDDFFTFVPPKGVDVIQERTSIGEF